MGYSEKALRFIAHEAASRDTIDFKRVYAEIAGRGTTGLLLSQIVYYYLPFKGDTVPKIPRAADGRYWLCFERSMAWGECCLTENEFRSALARLEEIGLVETMVGKPVGLYRRSTFLCLDLDTLADLVEQRERERMTEIHPRVDLSVVPEIKGATNPVSDFSPTQSVDFTNPVGGKCLTMVGGISPTKLVDFNGPSYKQSPEDHKDFGRGRNASNDAPEPEPRRSLPDLSGLPVDILEAAVAAVESRPIACPHRGTRAWEDMVRVEAAALMEETR